MHRDNELTESCMCYCIQYDVSVFNGSDLHETAVQLVYVITVFFNITTIPHRHHYHHWMYSKTRSIALSVLLGTVRANR